MIVKKPYTNTRVKKKTKPTKRKKALLVAQEIKFTRLLANSDKKVTFNVLKSLRKWLTARSESNYAFTETDFLRLWKGLFYCMWLSDKPLVQEETADAISKLVHCFKSMDTMLLYIKSTLKSLSSQWFGIDKYRVDKFEMLLRKIIRQTFVVFRNHSYNLNYIQGFTKKLEELLMDQKSSLGMIMQINEVFMEELAKISGGDIPTKIVTELLKPFVIYIISRSEEREIRSVMKNIFRYLIFQSDVGLEYQEKFKAWRAVGFPSGSIKNIEKIELSDEDNTDCEDNMDNENESLEISNNNLDPRAGRVDVELPQIPFNAKQILKLLTRYKFHESSTTKARKQLQRLINEFEELSKGEMPLGIQEINIPAKRKSSAFLKRAAARLLRFESELYSDTVNKKKKKCKFSDSVASEEKIENQNEISNKISKNKKENQKCINNKTEDKNLVKNSAKKNRNQDISKEKITNQKKNRDIPRSISFCVEDFGAKTLNEVEDTTKCSTTNGWNVSEIKPTASPFVAKSLKPVIEKLDINHTDFIKEILKKSALSEKSKKVFKTPNNSPTKSTFKTPNTTGLCTPKTKVLNPLSVKAKSETKKRVKIMLQKNTAQHTSEYFKQLKQSPTIPFDANRKPLTSVLKPSPIPSPINPFYIRQSY